MGFAEIWRRTVDDKKRWSWIKIRVTTICFRRTDSQYMKGSAELLWLNSVETTRFQIFKNISGHHCLYFR